VKIYLAGAIRDGCARDIAWREEAIERLSGPSTILNPLGGKRYFPQTRSWQVCGVPPAARMIVKQDFAMIDRADAVLFNFEAMKDGYPMIGSLVELGYATGKGKLCYAVWPNGLAGANAIYTIHPFIEQNCAELFPTVDDALGFLEKYLLVAGGWTPQYASTSS
jgi:nucleoside 2-deoxyribosyltransferase